MRVNLHDTTGKAFVGNNAGSFVPTVLSDLAATLDSQQRSKPGVGDYVKNRIPGAQYLARNRSARALPAASGPDRQHR